MFRHRTLGLHSVLNVMRVPWRPWRCSSRDSSILLMSAKAVFLYLFRFGQNSSTVCRLRKPINLRLIVTFSKYIMGKVFTLHAPRYVVTYLTVYAKRLFCSKTSGVLPLSTCLGTVWLANTPSITIPSRGNAQYVLTPKAKNTFLPKQHRVLTDSSAPTLTLKLALPHLDALTMRLISLRHNSVHARISRTSSTIPQSNIPGGL